MTLAEITEIYEGSDGDATKLLYAKLQNLGADGIVALNLFRAQKCSARAKVYRGGNQRGKFKAQAYERKQWSLDNLCKTLESQESLGGGPRFGWALDPLQAVHRWVLYVDLPTGQVSFHSEHRGKGPDYAGQWDGIKDASASRILQWTAMLFPPTLSQ